MEFTEIRELVLAALSVPLEEVLIGRRLIEWESVSCILLLIAIDVLAITNEYDKFI